MWPANLWLGVADIEGQLIVCYPKSGEQLMPDYSRVQDCIKPKSYPGTNGYIYSPLVIRDNCLGILLGKSDSSDVDPLCHLMDMLSGLLINQISNNIEKKELLRETLDTYREINLLYNIGDSISSCLDVSELARTILLESSKIIKSRSSSLMLLDAESGDLDIKSALGDKNDHRVKFKLGQGIAGIVAREAKYIIANNVSNDSRFIQGKKEIHALLCVPLKTKRNVLGVINVSDKLDGEMFTARDAKLISAVASHAANFIEIAIMHEHKLNEDRLKRNLERYLSPHILKSVLESTQELKLGGDKKNVTILFADIREFSSLSEEMEPELLVRFLNEYFTRMVDIIFKYGGTVDKFVGDEIMAIFGAPITQADDELRAIKTAVEMQQEMHRLQEYWQKSIKPFSIGIGINSGEVIAGNIGSNKHMDYTVIGDVVNSAKRLETQAAGGKILVSKNVRQKANELYEFKDVGETLVKGKKNPIEVFEVIY
ncbi:MAG: GAF domain-containing protein [Elusimicrobia bacterium]|nr:GAF domain-containing protein [Elusimicrobiota bacterium]